MIDNLLERSDLFVYLAATPLTWLTLTFIAYLVADRFSQASGRHPAVNLVALTAALVIVMLNVTGVSYETYFAGAQFIHFLLGPPPSRWPSRSIAIWIG